MNAFRKQLLTLVISLPAIASFAQTVPTTINYQGRLTDNTPSQVPVNATVQMQFAIYDAASGGTRLWQEPALDNTGTGVAVTTGIFNYVLGNTVAIPASVFSGATSVRYLQITLNPAGSPEILAPRQLITATGYANLAQNANSAVSATTAATATNATQLGGVAASGYLLTGGTAFDSSRLGGTLASGWQKALATPACPANQYLTTLNQNGTTTCTAASVTETDPKVGTLTTGRVPRWNATSLTDGSLYDTGSSVGIGTTSPIAPLHVAGGIPASVGSVATGTNPDSVYVQGRYAYVANYGGNTLQVIDVSNPAAPASVGSVATGNGPYSVYVQGRYAYVVNLNSNTLQIFDVSNPAVPASVGSVATVPSPRSVYVQGRYAYVANGGSNTLQVFDVSNPAVPASVGSVATGSFPISLYVQGRYAYVANYNGNTLQIFDVSNPAAPASVGLVAAGSNPWSVYVQGRYAYVANYASNTLQAFDLGGAYLQQLEAGGIETGTLATRGNAQIGGDADIKGGLNVGRGGIYSAGSVASSTGFSGDGSGLTNLNAGNLSANVPVGRGGTGADLSATGGASQYVKQSSAGGALTIGTIPAADVPNLDASKITTGTLPVARGGTNAISTPTAGAVTYGTGTAYAFSSAGTSGQLLQSGGAGAPTWGAAGTSGQLLQSGGAGAPTWGAVALATQVSGNLPIANAPTGGAWTLSSNLNLDSNTLVVDPASKRVGVGIASPLFPLDTTAVLGNTHARFGTANPIYIVSNNPTVGFNEYFSGVWKYGSANFAGNLGFIAQDGSFSFETAPAGAADATATMTARFTISNAGTVTVPSPGTLSIGVRLANCPITTPVQNCSCAAGETVVTGGGYRAGGGDIIRASYPITTTTWQIICTNTTGLDVNCGGMNIICDRRAP